PFSTVLRKAECGWSWDTRWKRWGTSFHRSKCQAAHELFLAEPAQQQDWGDREKRGRGELGEKQALRRREGGDKRCQCSGAAGGERDGPESLVPRQDDV